MTSSEILDRLPPSDLEAEKSVLGSILLQATVLDEIASVVKPDDFYADANRRLYTHLLALYDTGRPIDVVLLARHLQQAGDFEAVGGTAYIAEVARSVAVFHHARYYAGLVAACAKRRKLIHAAVELLRDAYEPSEDADVVVSKAETALASIRTSEASGEPVPIARACMETIERLQATWERETSPGLMVGLPPFDEDTGGLFGGELTILAARPSVGKSSLARQWAFHVASRGKLVYFASLEMTRFEIVTMLTCSRCGVANQAIRTRRLTDDERSQFSDEINRVASASMVIRDKPGLRVADIRREVRRLVKNGLALVVVDYLQLLVPPDRRVQRYEQVGQMTCELKGLAQEFDVPVLCLCQLSRAAATDGGWPKLHHLRESGSIEQDADSVLFIHIDPSGKQKRLERERTNAPLGDADVDDINGYLVAAKNRQGAKGGYRIVWHPETTTFGPPELPTFGEFDQFDGKEF